MSPVLERRDGIASLEFDLPAARIADRPIEARRGRRDEARMLVARRGSELLVDATAAELPAFLRAGDVLVVNTSATLPAAVPTGDGHLLHLSTELPGGLWVVELRRACGAGSAPSPDGRAGASVRLPGGGRADLLAPFPLRDRRRTTWTAEGRRGSHHKGERAAAVQVVLRRALTAGPSSRLWVAALDLPSGLLPYLSAFGRPIRYGYVGTAWPLAAYQTVFATVPGSAEMASAARPFTAELVTALVAAGVVIAPLVLHTGVSSQEAGEPPYPERYSVPAASAAQVNAARAEARRVVAVGTTVARALETVADDAGLAHPGSGWTEHVITAASGVRVLDGILTGWHEPAAAHLGLLEAVAGRAVLERSYAHALDAGYLWHEFGDVHLVLP